MAILEGTENVAEVQGWNACMSSLHLGWQGSRIEFQASLGYIARSYQKQKNKTKKKQTKKNPERRSMVELAFVSPTHWWVHI